MAFFFIAFLGWISNNISSQIICAPELIIILICNYVEMNSDNLDRRGFFMDKQPCRHQISNRCSIQSSSVSIWFAEIFGWEMDVGFFWCEDSYSFLCSSQCSIKWKKVMLQANYSNFDLIPFIRRYQFDWKAIQWFRSLEEDRWIFGNLGFGSWVLDLDGMKKIIIQLATIFDSPNKVEWNQAKQQFRRWFIKYTYLKWTCYFADYNVFYWKIRI